MGPGYRKKANTSSASIIDDDEEEDEDTTMERLKERLALHGKTTVGNSYPRLVKRFLDALDELDEADDSDDD